MQSPEHESCSDCSRSLLDVGDELVCPDCGVVKEKAVVEVGFNLLVRPSLLGKQPLGSYMGTKGTIREEKSYRGVSGADTSYRYMKVMSDFAGKDGGVALECTKMIERVGEKLSLPRVVILQAASISRKIIAAGCTRRRLTVAEVSAYSLIAACKILGSTSVSIREVISAHSMIGRRVTSSSIIQLTLESPIRTYARRPDEYIPRVMAKLSLNRGLSERLAKEGIPQTAFLKSLRDLAIELLRIVDRGEMVGKRPCALAASAVYSAEVALSRCEARKRRVTQRDIAECGDTAEYTIREQCASIFMPAVERLAAPLKQPLPPPRAH